MKIYDVNVMVYFLTAHRGTLSVQADSPDQAEEKVRGYLGENPLEKGVDLHGVHAEEFQGWEIDEHWPTELVGEILQSNEPSQ